jgi:feruloyl esterase
MKGIPNLPLLRPRLGVATLALLTVGACATGSTRSDPIADVAEQPAASWADRCSRFSGAEPGVRIERAAYHAAGASAPARPGPGPAQAQLPAHCELIGVMHERTGIDGQHYAIRFHLRLPEVWNGRLLFEGGGGTNGILGEAIGAVSPNRPPALAEGFAVLSQDSGHDNRTNSDSARGGAAAFGFDPQARADYGGASLEPVTLAARAAIESLYGRQPEHSYFVGCSKGGQEGMMLAQRYPDLYDGIIAASPGMSLPRAAVSEAWDTQAFAGANVSPGRQPTPATLAASFSDDDFGLLRTAVLKACDTLDGLADGIVAAVGQCTTGRVLPELARITCTAGKSGACLSSDQVEALRRVQAGAQTSRGEPIYADFPWDAGWFGMGWRIWKIGSADGRIPSINVAMGAPALATIFSTPPSALAPGLEAGLAYLNHYDFDRQAQAIYASGGDFGRSAWQDIGARSADLDAFRDHGGKMIVPHGVSDPVFSINDTIAWWQEVDQRTNGNAADFVRIFPVPGMAHCAGGPATDQFDAFSALVRWVEQGQAPARIEATAGPMSPWPNRSRPLCPFPQIARYEPGADMDKESSRAFVCG